MKPLISLIGIIIFVFCTCLSANASNICGSYDRYALKFLHVYHVYFETNINSLIEKYKEKYDTQGDLLNKNKVAQEVSSIIFGPANQEEIKLHLISTTSNTSYLEKEALRLAQAIRKSFGYEKDDQDFMNDDFLLGVKGTKYKDLQKDILNYTNAIDRCNRTRYIGDQFILSVEKGKGILEYKPFNKDEKVKLIEDADSKIIEINGYILETEMQLGQLPFKEKKQNNKINQQGLTLKEANAAKKILKDKLYAEKKMLKKKLKMLKRKKNEIEYFKNKIVKNRVYQTIQSQKLVFEDPQIIRKIISSYIVKDRCLLDKMPDELLCILTGNIMSLR